MSGLWGDAVAEYAPVMTWNQICGGGGTRQRPRCDIWFSSQWLIEVHYVKPKDCVDYFFFFFFITNTVDFLFFRKTLNSRL